VRLARVIARTKAFERFLGREVAPGAHTERDEDVEAFVRQHAQVVHHPVGTCKMGVDSMAVVDPEPCVHGLKGLRVVDASVMPVIPRGHTNASVIMIAEKAADLTRGRPAEPGVSVP